MPAIKVKAIDKPKLPKPIPKRNTGILSIGLPDIAEKAMKLSTESTPKIMKLYITLATNNSVPFTKKNNIIFYFPFHLKSFLKWHLQQQTTQLSNKG